MRRFSLGVIGFRDKATVSGLGFRDKATVSG